MDLKNRNRAINIRYATAVLLIFLATTGFPSFLQFKALQPLLIPFLWYRYSLLHREVPKGVKYLLVVIALYVILQFGAGHLSIFGSMSIMLSMITLAYSALVCKDTFVEAFVRLMKFFSYIAVPLWLLIAIVPTLHTTLMNIGAMLPQLMTDTWLDNTSNYGVSFYVYFLSSGITSSYTSFLRNCGPFYEPGLYASYLTIALVFNLHYNRKLLHKGNLILIAALLTTLSSAGYVSLALVVLYSMLFSKKLINKLISLSVIILLWQPMLNSDIVSTKISENFDNASMSTASRFGAVMYHIEKIQLSPFIGYAGSKPPATDFDRYLGMTDSERVLSPNGLSYSFVYWGIPLAIIFYILLFKGIKQLLRCDISRIELWMVFIIILSAAFSQTITTEPVFMLIAIISITRISNVKSTTKSSRNPYLFLS